ncbi:Peptidase_M14_like domain containing protein [Comamonadaceae bacterium]
MTMRVTPKVNVKGEAGADLLAGTTYTVSDALGAALVGSGRAVDVDGVLNPKSGEPARLVSDPLTGRESLQSASGGLAAYASLPTEKYVFPELDAATLGTYSAFISAVDAFCVGKSVLRTDRGLCSDGVNRIYDYRAGTGPINILLLAGQHGAEVLAHHAAFVWFKEFVASNDVVFSTLRRQITVTYVPCVNPYAFNSARKNANSVDLNRNWNFYWTRYTPPSAENAKGASAFSEVETQAIKAIIDARGCSAFIDCHSQEAGYSANDVMVSPPSFFALHNRHIFNSATKLWKSAYSGVFAEMVDPMAPEPTFINWAAFYASSVKGDQTASSVLIEAAADLNGSSVTKLTSAAATKYCGFLTSWILAYIGQISTAPPLPMHSWQARRVNEAAATSIASAGSMIDVTSFTAFTFDEAAPWPAGFPRNYLDCPMVMRGYLEVFADGYIQSAGGGEQRVDIGISLDGAAPANHALDSITIPATAGLRTDFSISGKFEITTIDAAYVPRIQLQMMRVGTTQLPFVKRARLLVRFVPHSDVAKTPNF